MLTVGELKKIGLKYADKLGADRSASEFIIMHKFGVTRAELIIGEKALPDAAAEELRGGLERFSRGEPLQYIVGSEGFMSLKFKVTSDVLIPRPETELLVETLIDMFKDFDAPTFIDVGAGSGCIAVSLAKYLPTARITALDISPAALSVAAENAAENGVSDRIDFIRHDIMRGFPNLPAADCVVSNPPYIRDGEIPSLDKNVRDFEPLIALRGGEDGLDFYRRITKCAVLKSGGVLAYETGFDQSAAVGEILRRQGFKDIRIIPDLEGRGRVVLGVK